MPKIAMLNQEGAKVGEIELSEGIFASEINESVIRSQIVKLLEKKSSVKPRAARVAPVEEAVEAEKAE